MVTIEKHVFARKKPYYHIDQAPKKRAKRKSRKWPLILAFLLFGAGAYLFVLLQSPNVLQNHVNAASEEEQLISNHQNFVKIEKINVLVPFNAGDNASVLEKGAWWRYPDRGNPEKGGNFILAAHRFRLGATPNKTKQLSPFYHIDEVQQDDVIDIFYNSKWYSYKVTKKFDVKPQDTDIEAPSDQAKLTLYTCSLKGSSDGRVVIIAEPFNKEATTTPNSSDNPFL